MKNWHSHFKMIDLKKKKGCSEKNALIKVFLKETPNDEKFKLLNHIFSCPECCASFEGVKEIWSKGKDLIGELEKNKFTQEEVEQLKAVAKNEIKKLKSQGREKRSVFFQLKKIAAVTSGIIIIILISLFVIMRGHQEIDLERKTVPGIIEIIEPIGDTNESFLRFRWMPVSKAKNYTLEILDIGLETFYLTEQINSDRFLLPEEIFERLEKGKTYFWKIIVNRENGQKIESEFGKFKIIND